MILRCTNKLLAVLGASRAAEPGPTPDAEDWYANLLWFDRRKCLLLTHAATLFSIFETDVRAADLRATHRLVTELVERELRREGLPPATFGNLRSQELLLAKTADRSVLGCMNDMAFLCEAAISDAGGLAHIDPGELNHALHPTSTALAATGPRLSSPHNSLSVGNQADKKQARSKRHTANPAWISSRADITFRGEHHPPEYSVAAVRYVKLTRLSDYG